MRTRRSITALLAVVASLSIVGCSSSFDPDAPLTGSFGGEDGSTPIPEGTPIIEHEHVPVEARRERIDLVENLVLAGGLEPFYRLIGVDTDGPGNIFVYDAGNDCELLSHEYALSVDEVSMDSSTCWNLASPGIRGVDATLEYLAKLHVDKKGNGRLKLPLKSKGARP